MLEELQCIYVVGARIFDFAMVSMSLDASQRI